ncbi:MAG: c-type cytochrome [Nitrospinota bacterium]
MKKALRQPVILGIAVFALFLNEAGATGNEGNLSVGAQIYKENCRVCHGDKGNGKTFVANVLKPPPRNFTSPMVINTLSREQMVASVTNGRPGTAMMPWKTILTSEEIKVVIDHIRQTFMKP